MNFHKATLAMVILLIAGAFLYEHNKTREIQGTLASFTKDRDALKRQLSELSRQVAEAKAREAAASATAEAPRNEVIAPKPPVSRADEPPQPGVTGTAPAGWAKNGNKTNAYLVGVDNNQTFGGMPSAYMQSIDPSVVGFGGMMQTGQPDVRPGPSEVILPRSVGPVAA